MISLTREIESKTKQDFPGGRVVKNPPVRIQGHGFDPPSGKIPHAAGQPSRGARAPEPTRWGLRAATPELAFLEPVVCNKRKRGNEKPVHHA